MGLMMGLLPSCREVAWRLATGEYDEASWPRRLLVRWHLSLCALCQKYEAQLRLLADAFRRRAQAANTSPGLPALQARVIERLARG